MLIPHFLWRRSSPKREARRSLRTGLAALSATALAIALLPQISGASENKGNTMTYPPTERTDTVDTHFGTTVADPYRWLESDIRRDGKVEAWITKQKNLTEDYLATLPGRDLFKLRLQALFDHERSRCHLKSAAIVISSSEVPVWRRNPSCMSARTERIAL
ncbi:hypothetical protein [Rhizobium sp. SEMIA 4085]|uniref:hypothetical protein n=1 Tax=Rhizobium sp. SEMIA 4085 TaxID=2137761 RepID=UPI001AEEDE7C|nr:hypothetical protein [Rhizobium sp. SEMIA 4085]